jgi:hypothetical protein
MNGTVLSVAGSIIVVTSGNLDIIRSTGGLDLVHIYEQAVPVLALVAKHLLLRIDLGFVGTCLGATVDQS